MERIHNCHSWTLDGVIKMFSVHVAVKKIPIAKVEEIRKTIHELLKNCGIYYATVEIETEASRDDLKIKQPFLKT